MVEQLVCQLMIDERNSQLQPVSHAHYVRIPQQTC